MRKNRLSAVMHVRPLHKCKPHSAAVFLWLSEYCTHCVQKLTVTQNHCQFTYASKLGPASLTAVLLAGVDIEQICLDTGQPELQCIIVYLLCCFVFHLFMICTVVWDTQNPAHLTANQHFCICFQLYSFWC